MTRRTYGQFCGLARGLDVVGERWTLLIVRELMSGAKRYVDLAQSLEGIGTSLLATRLRQLEQDGVVSKRRLPAPAASVVYELTPEGNELGRALLPLALWGVRYHTSSGKTENDAYRAEWALVFIAQLIDEDTIGNVDFRYHFKIDHTYAVLRLANGRAMVEPSEVDPVDPVDATVTMDSSIIIDVSAGRLSITEALCAGRVLVTGDAEAAAKLVEVLPDTVALR